MVQELLVQMGLKGRKAKSGKRVKLDRMVMMVPKGRREK